MSSKGIDVSSYQGEIDWSKVKAEEIQFAILKVIRKDLSPDKMFEKNYQDAQKNEMCVGAYHFFSTKSGGKEQADNFIKTVGDLKGKLPPVVDVEVYGNDDGSYDVVDELKKYMTVIYDQYCSIVK